MPGAGRGRAGGAAGGAGFSPEIGVERVGGGEG